MSITLEQAQEFLRITSSDKDDILTTVIDASVQMIEDFTGLDMTYEANALRTYDGTGSDFIRLTAPVTDLISVTIDNVVQDITNFRVKNGYLETLDGSVIAEGRNNVIILATVGQETWNADLLLAQRMLVAWLYDKDKDKIGSKGKQYKDYVVEYENEIPNPIRIILQNYKVSVL